MCKTGQLFYHPIFLKKVVIQAFFLYSIVAVDNLFLGNIRFQYKEELRKKPRAGQHNAQLSDLFSFFFLQPRLIFSLAAENPVENPINQLIIRRTNTGTDS